MPSAAELLAADPKVLRESGFSARKAATLRDLAQRFVDGRLSDEALAGMTDEEVEVPDVAAGVLGVPVGRPLSKPPAQVEPVPDDDAGDPFNRLRRMRHRHDVA